LETENKYKYTKAYFKIRDLIINNPKETVFVICGGQGASKTVSIIELVIQSLLSSVKEATILSSELSKMKRTVIRDYKKICKDWGVMSDESDFNRSESKHEYFNGSYLDFLGADVNDVGKGFRRDLLYINEADKMPIDTAVQFISRAKLTIIDYNPDKLFWGDDYINENNFLRLTFEDNEYLPKSEVDSILDYRIKGFFNPFIPFEKLFKEENVKNKYWANKWKVYGLGLVGSLDGVVFHYTVGDYYENEYGSVYGMDQGFTHPTAVVKVFVDRENARIYIKEVFYKTQQTSDTIYQAIKDEVGYTRIWCDSAVPMFIKELKNKGLNIKACKKPKIIDSINTILNYDIIIDKNSVNLQREFDNYRRADKDSETPVDDNNHAIDAFRYAFTHIVGTKIAII
jgi:phage terminase large subunit